MSERKKEFQGLSGYELYCALTKEGGTQNELLRPGPSAPRPITPPPAPATR